MSWEEIAALVVGAILVYAAICVAILRAANRALDDSTQRGLTPPRPRRRSALKSPESCVVCGWEFVTATDDPDRTREDQIHRSSLLHRASELGEPGWRLLEAVRADRERYLRRMGIIP